MEDLGIKPKKKIKWQIIVPALIAVILIVGFFYVTYSDKKPNNSGNEGDNNIVVPDYKPVPVLPSDNLKRKEPLDPEMGYGCAGPAVFEKMKTLKEPDANWTIKTTGETTRISLGKYRIITEERSVMDITKLWLYFFSKDLSERDDDIYGLEESFTSKIFLTVNGQEKEIKLGGPEYMLIELDFPLGDLYPYDKAAALEFEFSIEFKCKNIKDGKCLDNSNEPLKYLDNKEIVSFVRFFAVGCQEFTYDLKISSKFKYE
jgi:hypothetical protein